MAFLTRAEKRRLVKLLLSLVAILIIYTATQMGFQFNKDFTRIYKVPPPGKYRVVDVADGDTFTVLMAGEDEEVRLVGVDTPETHHPSKPVQCYGPQASSFTTSLLKGKTVKLVADTQQPSRDKYGRLLRYVVLDNGKELNELLVSNGYAFATNFNTQKKALLHQLQDEAEAKKIGLWGKCSVSTITGYYQTNPL